MKSWIKTIAVASFSAGFLMGCTTAGNAIPQGGPTMAQVYEEAMQYSNGTNIDQVREEIKSPVIALNTQPNLNTHTPENDKLVSKSICMSRSDVGTERNIDVSSEINNLFPTLPNPQLVMHVYPHLAGEDEAPVPGYSTAFSLYEKEHYALSGEV